MNGIMIKINILKIINMFQKLMLICLTKKSIQKFLKTKQLFKILEKINNNLFFRYLMK